MSHNSRWLGISEKLFWLAIQISHETIYYFPGAACLRKKQTKAGQIFGQENRPAKAICHSTSLAMINNLTAYSKMQGSYD